MGKLIEVLHHIKPSNLTRDLETVRVSTGSSQSHTKYSVRA